jgi:hypothetical protein
MQHSQSPMDTKTLAVMGTSFFLLVPESWSILLTFQKKLTDD